MQTFKAVFHLDNQTLRGFLADTREFNQRSRIFALNGIDELRSGHAGQNSQRQLRPDAVGFDQLAKQHPFLFVVEAIQQLGIFTHHKLGKDNRLFARVRQLIEAGHRHMDFIAHATDFQQH